MTHIVQLLLQRMAEISQRVVVSANQNSFVSLKRVVTLLQRMAIISQHVEEILQRVVINSQS